MAPGQWPFDKPPARIIVESVEYSHVMSGLTVKRNRSFFDAAPPHPNHWATCKARDRARKDLSHRA